MGRYERVEIVTKHVATWTIGNVASDGKTGKQGGSGHMKAIFMKDTVEEIIHCVDVMVEEPQADDTRGWAYSVDYIVYKDRMYEITGSRRPLYEDQTDNTCIAWDLLVKEVLRRRRGRKNA